MNPPDFTASEAELRRQLLRGTHRHLWEASLGPAEYRKLRGLVQQVRRRGARGGPRVYILPGMMGSKLADRHGLLWIDPQHIREGRLLELALRGGEPCDSPGVMVLSYLKLKLSLEKAGFRPVFHAYDWRQSIRALGDEFAARLRRERARSVAVVAHSMGGLVSRMAMACLEHGAASRRGKSAPKIRKLITLATPHFGSFAPVLALRGVYPAVRKVAMLDPRHSAEELTRRVFNAFPGLYDMLPAPERFSSPDLLDAASWPQDRLSPRRRLLKGVRRLRTSLAPADERFSVLIGVNQDTVTDLRRASDGFSYVVTRNGDGTVPVSLARLPRARTWYVEENHGSMAANGEVCAAVIDLLKTGATRRLAQHWARRSGRRNLSESALRQTDVRKVDWAALGQADRLRFARTLILPAPTMT